MSTSNWWASKLGNNNPQPQQPPSTQSLPPQYVQQNVPQIPQPVRAETCPNCNSGNYGKMTPETRARCYDCGYPLVQQGSGIGTTSSSNGPAQPARQAEGGGWNPGTIVGKI